ncbi:MAG: hypothetical protein HQK96_06865 [Nitrospirae bacterium]|nr:hypothetical protein [Nitrospirota bacterium]
MGSSIVMEFWYNRAFSVGLFIGVIPFLAAITTVSIVTLLLTRLSNADVLAPDIYTLRAMVALKTEEYPIVTARLPFSWTKDMITPANSGEGWIEKDGYFVWIPGREKPVLKIPLEISALNGVNVGTQVFPRDFNELWIDYKDINPQGHCDVTAVLNLNPITGLTHRGDVGQIDYATAVGGKIYLEPTEIIDVVGAVWKKKGIMYSFKRDFGLSFDDDWRYVQDNDVSVIQRRFHKDIATFEAIDLEFSIGTETQAVNLKLGFGDRPKPDATVTWGELPKEVIKDRDKTIVRVWLGRYVRKNYPNKEKAFLEELIVHVDGQVGQVVKERPFEKIVFQGYEDDMTEINNKKETYTGKKRNTKEGIKTIFLPSKIDELNTGLNRIKVDIKELSGVYINDNETVIKSALLEVEPPDPDVYGGIRLEGVWAVSSSENKRPVVLQAIDNVTRNFGGPFPNISRGNGHVEALKFLNYYSFNKSNYWKTSNKNYPLGKEGLTSSNKLLQENRDVKIIANRITSSDNELAVEGDRENRLEILWSTDTIIEEDTLFLLRLSNGDELVKYGLMTIKSSSGDEFRRTFEPNKALDLTGIKGRITEIGLRMELDGSPFVIKLKDMALFRPVSLLPSEVLNIPRPIDVHEPLNPEIYNKSGGIDASRGLLKGIVWRHGSDAASALEWNTKVDNQTGIRGVHFNFENSGTVNIENPCWLSLQFVGEHQRISRDICSGSQEGHFYNPIPDIFAEGGADKLRLITWKVDMGKQIVENNSPLIFKFQMYLERSAWQSISEEMQNSAILSAGGKNLYPKETKADFAAELLSGGVWLDMGIITDANIKNDIKILDNPYLKVTSVVAERVLQAGQLYKPEFEKQVKVLVSPWPKRFVKLGLLAFIIAALVHVWRKGWLQWLWQKIKLFIGFIMSYLRIIREKTWTKLLPGDVHKMIFWILLSGIMYFTGLITAGAGINSLFSSVGGLSGFMALSSLLWLIRPMIMRRWSAASVMIYEERGNVYILGLMVTTIGCAVFLVLKSEIATEQLAIIGYYCLVAGVAQKVWQMKKETKPVSETKKCCHSIYIFIALTLTALSCLAI